MNDAPPDGSPDYTLAALGRRASSGQGLSRAIDTGRSLP